MTASLEHPSDCQNCGTRLAGPFCAACGQKRAPLNPSLHSFAHELVHELTHFDGRILLSLRLLLRRPGLLSREQFAGRRARYVPPIRLYLIFSVAYFVFASFVPAGGFEVTCTSCPPDQRSAIEQHMREILIVWIPRVMFVLVPAFAALVALATRRSGRNYPQHLYFALHTHAAWFFAATVGTLIDFFVTGTLRETVSAAVILYSGVYLLLALRRAYGMPTRAAAWRALAVGSVYMLLTLVATAAIVFPLVYREFGQGQ